MASITAVTDILDANGNTLVDAVDIAGRKARLPIAIKCDASVTPTVTRVGDTMVVTLAANGSASVEGEDIAPATVTTTGDVVVGGKLVLGPNGASIFTSDDCTTTGPGSSTLLSFPVPDNRGVPLNVTYGAVGPAGFAYNVVAGIELISSGSLTPLGFDSPIKHSLGIPPSMTATWTAGVLTLTANGPQDAVTLTSSASGHLQIVVASANLSTELVGLSVTISGLSGTPGGNGTHVVTAATQSTFDIGSVAFVAPDMSGTVVLTTPPVLKWEALAIAVIAG